jgi:DNA-binding GntR family transcriptional regulator
LSASGSGESAGFPQTGRPPTSKAEYVHETLRREIVNGVHSPGSSVNQEEVATRLGVSITPVREALRRLESDGLVTYRAHHGATVSGLGVEAAEELRMLRAAVEGLTARLAAQRITETQLAELTVLHERMVADSLAGDSQAMAQDSRLFHLMVADIGGPAFLGTHVRAIRRNNPILETVSRWKDPDNVRSYLDAHGQMLVAFARRDGDEAERLMAEHIRAPVKEG